MLENIINSLIEGIGGMLIMVVIPTIIALAFFKWVHSTDNKGGSKNDK